MLKLTVSLPYKLPSVILQCIVGSFVLSGPDKKGKKKSSSSIIKHVKFVGCDKLTIFKDGGKSKRRQLS